MKFISSTYKDGISRVKIKHLGYTFNGWAALHPDDKDHASEITGGRIAETRATIKALKYERWKAKQESETIRKFVKKCEECKDFDKNSPTAHIMYRQMKFKIKKVNDLADQINALIEHLQTEIIRRDILLNKRKEKASEDKVD